VNYVRAPLLRARERFSSFVSSLLVPTECVPRSVRIMPAERMRIGDRTLPVRRLKERIIDKIKLNRVTLICGFTGSGKSSQVPQMLLEEGLAPVLCTQPRRLAVVAVAKRVAKERGCVLGQEVGYHIGQLNISSSKYSAKPMVSWLQSPADIEILIHANNLIT
jgi:HrpA-like RNA helicase